MDPEAADDVADEFYTVELIPYWRGNPVGLVQSTFSYQKNQNQCYHLFNQAFYYVLSCISCTFVKTISIFTLGVWSPIFCNLNVPG
jgi:hypothetical protein